MIRRVAIYVFWCANAFALSNSVILTNESAAEQTNRVITIPRYFAQGEVCGFPQPYSAASAIPNWQADVKTRWAADAQCAGGYVKFALITIEKTIPANGSIEVEFRSATSSCSSGTQAQCAASGLTKQEMLAFDTGGGAGSWGAKIESTTGGIRKSASARTMLTADQYQVLESGPLRTSILIREGPASVSALTTRATSFGFQCTGTCTAPYSNSTWADNPTYYSMRPSFVVTFYPSPTGGASNSRVETDYILDNGWFDRIQDQRHESFVLYKGGSENTACYTAPAAFVQPAAARIMETCWSTDPPATKLDFGREYMIYSKVIPAYGLDLTVGASAVALELAAFNATDQGEITTAGIAPMLGWGQWSDRDNSTGGGGAYIAIHPRWTVRYLLTFDSSLLNVMLANANAAMHAPIFFIEHDTSNVFMSGHSATADKGFGRPMSIDSRSTVRLSSTGGVSAADSPKSPNGDIVTTSCAAPNCMVAAASGAPSALAWKSLVNTTVNRWGQDLAHATDAWFIPYLVSGKFVYLEAQNFKSAWAVSWGSQESPPTSVVRGRWGSKGLIIDADNTIRSTAWALRNLGNVALLNPDGSVEKEFFSEKLSNNITFNEGRWNVNDQGRDCSGFDVNTETDIWRMGRCFYESGWPNPLFHPMKHNMASCCASEGNDLSLASESESPWKAQYAVVVFARLRDLGFAAQYIHEAMAKYTLHITLDRAFTDGPQHTTNYRNATVNAARNGYLQTWAEVRAARLDSVTLARGITNADTNAQLLTRSYTGGNPVNNNFNLSSQGGMYCSMGSEIIRLDTCLAVSKAVSAVNAATDRATSAGHGLSDGQMIRLNASTIDPGVAGNSRCKVGTGGTRNGDCDFWVKVIDTNTLEFYTDASLTTKVDLQGGGTSIAMHYASCTISRGLQGTNAASHSTGAVVTRHPIIVAPSYANNPSRSHGPYYTSGLATAVDYDVSDKAESGGTITARRAWEFMSSNVPFQDRWGSNIANCGAVGLDVDTCDNPVWGIKPRPTIRNVRIIPGMSTVEIRYVAPSGGPCKYAVQSGAFISSNDVAQSSDTGKNRERLITVSGLNSASAYQYSISCGAARITGGFQTR